MFVGVLELRFSIVEADGAGRPSPKVKRSVARSLVDRVRARFDVAVAEVGEADEPRRLVVGFSAVGPDSGVVDGVLSRVRDAAQSHLAGRAELIEAHLDILNVSFEYRRP